MDGPSSPAGARAEPRSSPIRSTLQARARALFGIDLRSLALFRIAAALLILVDLASRAQLLAVNYTDAGAQPRAVVLQALEPGVLPSLHLLAGSYRAELALFALAALLAALLGVGYRTRLATLASWFLLDSLHVRNALVLDGGDHLLRHLLFWSIFLPLGARWSLDARRRGQAPGSFVLSAASAALLLQVGCMFFMSGLLKTGPEWADGTAIQYALSRKWWVQPFGVWLLDHPEVPQLLTPAVRAFEMLGAVLLFVPVFTAPMRLLMIPAFLGLLAGLGLGLKLNLFPWIAALGMLPFVPALAWDALARRARPPAAARARGLEEPSASHRGQRQRARSVAAIGVHAGVLALVAVTACVNAGAASERLAPPPALARLARALHLEHVWWMYAPSPRRIDAWLEHRGRLVNGAPVDLDRATGGASWTRHVKRAWQDYRFLYYLQKLLDPMREPHAAAYAQWLCREWNADRMGGARLDTLTVSVVIQPISLGDEPKAPREERLASALCPR